MDQKKENYYLEPGFDPHSIKVSAIRNILVKHNIPYPSTAKKSELVELVKANVLNKASKLRKEARKQKRTKPDGRDIEVVITSPTARTTRATRSAHKDKDDSSKSTHRKSAAATRTDSAEDAKKKKKKKPSKLDTKKISDSGAEPKKRGRKRKASEAASSSEEAQQYDSKAPSRSRQAKRESAQDSGDEGVFTPVRSRPGQSQKQRIAKRRVLGHADKTVRSASSDSDDDNAVQRARAAQKQSNFSDDNPFQSSPDTTRKRRRKNTATDPADTPMAAVRKSKPSSLSFHVQLPSPKQQVTRKPVESGTELSADLESEDDPPSRLQSDDIEMSEEKVPDSVEPEAHADSELEIEDVFASPLGSPQHAIPRPSRPTSDRLGSPSARPKHRTPPILEPSVGRFTMTPDALRQMAATRRKTVATQGLPPVAPNIPAAPRDARYSYVPALEQTDAAAQTLQRRRVATLRQRRDSVDSGHSRRSSIASIAESVSEERGIPRIATTGVETSTPVHSTKGSSWLRKTLFCAALGAAACVWRTHEQFAIGYGSTRAEIESAAPPRGSLLALPEPLQADAPLVDVAKHYVQVARARYLEPPALSCPAHAECVPYVPVPAMAASAMYTRRRDGVDQWVVPANGRETNIVKCDPGHVLVFPHLSSRMYPRAPQCIRDVSTEHRVRQLADAMIRVCNERRGRVQCEKSLYEQARELLGSNKSRLAAVLGSEPTDESEDEDEADQIEALGVSAQELRSLMRARKAPRLSEGEFADILELAVDELVNRRTSEVVNFILEFEDDDSSSSSTTEELYFVSRNPAFPPLCQVRRMLLTAVLGNLGTIIGVIFGVIFAYITARRISIRGAQQRAADALVVVALERLRRQARRHYVDPALSPSPAVPSLQLRDILLVSSGSPPPGEDVVAYYDPRTRASVWERVRGVVERNANVRCRTTAVRGEPMRVWEWIGPIDEDEDLVSPLASPIGSP